MKPAGKPLQIIGMILGLLSFIFVIVPLFDNELLTLPYVAFVFGLVAIILSAVGNKKAKRTGGAIGMGVVGMIFGILGLLGSIIWIVYAVILVALIGAAFGSLF